MLPFGEGKKVKVRELTHLGHEYFGKDLPKNWKSYMFKVKPEDTIQAVRKGIVVEIIDEYDSDVSKDYSFKRKMNHILVEQKDGTLCRYSGFKKGSIFVAVGDKIFPHQPMGLLDIYDNEGSGELRLMIYYFDREKYRDFENQEDGNYYSYLYAYFHTKSGNLSLIDGKTYEVSVNNDLICEEMTKRERKKYLGSK